MPRSPQAALLAVGVTVLALTFGSARAADPAPLEDLDAACATDNPFFVTPCYALGVRDSEPALVAFRDTPDNSEHFVLARFNEIGSTYGVAYDWRNRYVYAAAYHKRASPFGPGGPGMVYRVDLATGDIEHWLDVPNAGDNHHDPTQNYIPDLPARDWPGRTSLGDIDLSDDGQRLYVMNLFTREILVFDTADASLVATIPHGASGETWSDAEARPHGLKIWQGKLYHGLVRDATVSDSTDDLWAYVYESELDGSGMREVLALHLDYTRGPIPPDIPSNWLPWRDDTVSAARPGLHDHAYIYPMPMLVDMEFSDSGDMILGLRDRIGDMSLYARNRNLPPGERSGHPFGDILLADRDGDRWTVDPWPEHFYEDAGGGMNATGGFHIDTGFGGLARIWSIDAVMNTAVSPEQYHSGGAIWFDIAGGGDLRRETLYVDEDGRTNFGKANGLGDAELLCAPPLAPSPTPSSTASPTSTASSTPTPSYYEIYLPFLNRDKHCVYGAYRADVVLVLDRSTSMLRPVEPGGLPKNEAAIAAAKSFVDLLDLEPDRAGRHDQVAVVGFNDLAWIESGLTHDRAAAMASLDRIREKTQEGTRLDLAFTWGQKPLDGPERKPENRPVIIMLTDGLPNRVPFGEDSGYPGSKRQEDSVLQAVDSVKLAGTRVYTVGLGNPRDILAWLLIDSASERWMYHYAPRPEDLAAIYARIAATFNSCDPKPAPTPCVPAEQHADVVLVLDLSTSMLRSTRTGRAKYQAAVDAARTFVSELHLEPDGWGRQDQVAVVGFNNEAWTAIGLSDIEGAVLGAIDGLEREIAEGTRIDLALAEGQRVYEVGERLQPNQPVMILLTDGLPNRVPFGERSAYPQCPDQECTVLKVARDVKARGTLLFTIGLGETSDVLRRLLEQVATDPGRYYFAPDGEDLAGIYREIAGRLDVCP